MSVVTVSELAYVRLQAPDLDVAEGFLHDFGLVRATRTESALFMRATDAGTYCHITELGPARLLGFAFHVDSADDLERLARVKNASAIEDSSDPAGGRRVRLLDPNGFTVEALYGAERLAALDVVAPPPLNSAENRLRRVGVPFRRPPGAARVKRLGHVVISSIDLRATLAWYRETLGFLASDDVYLGTPEHLVASFNRLNRGEEYVDHHVLMAIQGSIADLNHVGFEVQDVDDLLFGDQHLKDTARHEHRWGIGRHLLGSQVFNQWADPWGRVHEHWTDTDMLNAQSPADIVPLSVAFTSQWGEPPPAARAALTEAR